LLETSDKHDGKYFVWTANDGRKAYGLVEGSLVYFGNDESAIEMCMAVKRGEADSIAKNPKITNGERLAFGYVSPEGVAQIANIAGLSLAKQSSEEGEVQSFISRALPEILRNSLKDATWTATKTDEGIVDRYSLGVPPDVASVLNETLVRPRTRIDGLPLLSTDGAVSVTRYNLQDPHVAWRSLVLTAGKALDPASGTLIVNFSDGLFEPYGIEDPEKFLKSVESELFTVRFDESGENVVVVAKVKDPSSFEQSIASELRSVKPVSESHDGLVRRSADGELMLTTRNRGVIFLGDTGSVEKLMAGVEGNGNNGIFAKRMLESDSIAATTGVEKVVSKIVGLLSERKSDDIEANSHFLTESRLTKSGIDRRTVSDFGLIGWLMTQLSKEE